ncbi:MAG TPA: hypothetical protein VD907_00135 [Verrucomicrobiae bacterium]|nr:hypothetical protein [Verrucomicrobiae bacterium]
MTDRHPWIVLLGFFPPIYVLGVIRYWGRSWCMWDGGFFPISSPLPTLWWPIRMYQYKKLRTFHMVNRG